MELAQRVRSAVLRASESLEKSSSEPPRVGMVVDMSDANFIGGFIPSLVEKQKYPYSRPEFLFYSEEETTLSADQTLRPVVCPKQPHKMPLHAGYAEVINAGKTSLNEDQAAARMLCLVQHGYERAEEAGAVEETEHRSVDDDELLSPGTIDRQMNSLAAPRAMAALFAILDGHAGTAAAVVAAKCLHEHIKSRLGEVLESILHLDRRDTIMFGRGRLSSSSSQADSSLEITCDHLVIGALEAAFVDMDKQISDDKQVWRLPGGCAAIAALVLLGKVYVANAGDCRAVLVTADGARQISCDLTPANERRRLQTLAYHNPELIGNSYSRLEYSRHLTKKDLKSKVLYRDWFMDGWAAKTVKENDLRPPLVGDASSTRKRRLLNTIGVSRGFGDQHLLTVDERLPIKPFLSPVPEVNVLDLRRLDCVGDRDVLLLASDGLWDVLSNEDAAMIVRGALASTDPSDTTRYSLAAQELIIAARGSSNGPRWIMNSGSHASTDDITVFVIPLKHCTAAPQQKEDDEEDDELLCLDSE